MERRGAAPYRQHASRAKELRGFANLESAHTGGGIAEAKLAPCRCGIPKTDKKPNFSAKRLNYAHICDRII